jgi:hypothetical protein
MHIARGQMPSQRDVPRLAVPKRGLFSTGGLEISCLSELSEKAKLSGISFLGCNYSAVCLLHVFTCCGAAQRLHSIGQRDECSTYEETHQDAHRENG